MKGDTFATVNPATGEHLVNVAHASAEDVDMAVKAARTAFETTWGSSITGAERGRCECHRRLALKPDLHKIADIIERETTTLAALESLDSGKGISVAAGGDIPESVNCLRYYAGLADKIHGQTIDTFGGSKLAYTLSQPIGVCGQMYVDRAAELISASHGTIPS